MQDLVALKIKRPVTVAVELRDHLLLPVDIAPVLHLLVPRCLNYTDLRVTDRSDTLERVIATDPNGDYVLINNRQERPYALLERIAVRYRIAQEGEPGDYHRHRKTDLWAKTVVSSTNVSLNIFSLEDNRALLCFSCQKWRTQDANRPLRILHPRCSNLTIRSLSSRPQPL